MSSYNPDEDGLIKYGFKDDNYKNNEINVLITVNEIYSPYSSTRIKKAFSTFKKDEDIVGHNDDILEYITNGITKNKSSNTENSLLDEHDKHIDDLVKEYLSKCDGLVIPGNSNDINPNFYSGKNEDLKNINLEDKANRRTKIEIALVKEALTRGIPILGICGGNQVINVALGGQIKNVDVRESEVVYLSNTQLHGIIKSDNQNKVESDIYHEEKSLHHQAIVKEHLPEQLQIAAEDKDEMIKAIEIKGHHPWVIGTQFHPEHKFRPDNEEDDDEEEVIDEQNIALFEKFLDACRVVKEAKLIKLNVLKELKENTNRIDIQPNDGAMKMTMSNPSSLHMAIVKLSEIEKPDHHDLEDLARMVKSVAALQYVFQQIHHQEGENIDKKLLINYEQILIISKSSNVIKNAKDLGSALIYIPDDRRFDFAYAFKDVLKDFSDLSLILKMIPMNQQFNFTLELQNNFTGIYQLESVLSHLPIDNRFEIAIAYAKNENKVDLKYLPKILEQLPIARRIDFTNELNDKLIPGIGLERVLEQLPEKKHSEFLSLFNKNIDHIIDTENNFSMLDLAIKRQDLKVINSLLNAGSNPNRRGQYDFTPLQSAILMNSKIDTIETLLKAGSDPNLKDMLRMTALDHAIKMNNLPVSIMLLNRNIDNTLQICDEVFSQNNNLVAQRMVSEIIENLHDLRNSMPHLTLTDAKKTEETINTIVKKINDIENHKNLSQSSTAMLGHVLTPPSRPSEQTPPSRPSEQTPPSRPSEQTPPSRPSEQTPPSRPSGQTPPSRPSGQTPPSRPSGQTPPSRPTGQTPPSRPSRETAPSRPSEQTQPTSSEIESTNQGTTRHHP